MRSQNYGDKQREAQRRKREEELWKKQHPEGVPAAEVPPDTVKPDEKPKKPKKKETPGQGSA